MDSLFWGELHRKKSPVQKVSESSYFLPLSSSGFSLLNLLYFVLFYFPSFTKKRNLLALRTWQYEYSLSKVLSEACNKLKLIVHNHILHGLTALEQTMLSMSKIHAIYPSLMAIEHVIVGTDGSTKQSKDS